jgi:SNF family Na+-dependent transporter
MEVKKQTFEVELLPKSTPDKKIKWSTTEYYLLNLGTNIGIGCVWRFSYLMFNGGGGAFLLPFLLMNAFLIYPTLTLLISKGQDHSKGLLSIYMSKNPKYAGVALVKCLLTLCISTFYNYLLIYSLKYLMIVLFGDLPWLDDPLSEKLINLNRFFDSKIVNINDQGYNFCKIINRAGGL